MSADKRTPLQADHAAPAQLGGGKKPPKKRLPMIDPIVLPEDWDFEPGVPLTRAECEAGPRPCRKIMCKHHKWLVLQQDRPGNPAKGAQGDVTFAPVGASCVLDVSTRPHSLDEVGDEMALNPTRINQIEQGALAKLRFMAREDPASRAAIAAMLKIDIEALEQWCS